MTEILRHYFNLPPPAELTATIVAALDRPVEWFCWQTGMELRYGELTLIRINEISGKKPHTFMLRRDEEGELSESVGDNVSRAPSEESVWDVVELNDAGLLEIHLPVSFFILQFLPIFAHVFNLQNFQGLSLVLDSDSKIILTPAVESLCKLLTLGVEAVDNLLEDWYPSIGTRFVHTSEGKYLVTRLCPCPSCFPPVEENAHSAPAFRHIHSKSPRMSSDSGRGESPGNTIAEGDTEFGPGMLRLRTGLAFETPKFGGLGQSAGLNYFLRSDSRNLGSMSRNYYAWTVEHCILEAQTSKLRTVKCPKHGDIPLSHVAPDVLFYDLPTRYLLNQDDLVRKGLLGEEVFCFYANVFPEFRLTQKC